MSRTAKTIKTSDDRIIHITSMAYGATVSVREGGRFHERKLWIQPADDTDACGWVFLRGEFREVVYDSMGYKCIGERSADEYVPETVAWEIPETVEVEEQVVEERTVKAVTRDELNAIYAEAKAEAAKSTRNHRTVYSKVNWAACSDETDAEAAERRGNIGLAVLHYNAAAEKFAKAAAWLPKAMVNSRPFVLADAERMLCKAELLAR